jgi:hypothetical protein
MHESQMVIPREPQLSLFMPDAHFRSYGMGWMLQDYKGRKIIQHGGAIDGMIAMVGMIPEERLGVVVLSNLQGQLLPTALMFRVFDSYLGGSSKDWSGQMLKGMQSLEEQAKAAQKKLEGSRVNGTQPSLTLEKYSGTYKDEALGDAKVSLENGKLVLRTPSFVADLEHWHYDTFRATTRDLVTGKTFATFTLDSQGKTDTLTIPDLGVTFKRGADAAKPSAAISMNETDLKKFAGKYEMKAPPIEVSIEIVGGKLKANLPGQPVYTLVPVAANRFQIEGAPEGFFVQFDVVGDTAKSLTFEQGSGPKLTLYLKQ